MYFSVGELYSLVMIDMPLVYEDTAFLGDVEAFQCRVPCRAEEGRGLCQAQGRKTGACLWELLAPTYTSPQ